MADLHFELVTPDRLVMSDDVYMVVVPGTEASPASSPATRRT
jgi:F-type H+-transporting ATPase subunit epsilon